MRTRSSDAAGGAGEPTDEMLLSRIAASDPQALEVLYGRYKAIAFALAARITSDRGLAEDVLQESFLGVWRQAARYTPERGSARTWVLAIVHHRAIDALRRRRLTAQLPDADVPPPPSLQLPDIWPEVAGRLDREAIVTALGSLPKAQREVLELAYFEGLTQAEIVTRTGAPLGTVKSRARLGLLALRDRLVAPAVIGESRS